MVPDLIAKGLGALLAEGRGKGAAGRILHEGLAAGPRDVEKECSRCGRTFFSAAQASMCNECREEFASHARVRSFGRRGSSDHNSHLGSCGRQGDLR